MVQRLPVISGNPAAQNADPALRGTTDDDPVWSVWPEYDPSAAERGMWLRNYYGITIPA
jgi:hypothetical protein